MKLIHSFLLFTAIVLVSTPGESGASSPTPSPATTTQQTSAVSGTTPGVQDSGFWKFALDDLVSLASFVFVVFLFYMTRSDRKRDKVERKRDRRADIKATWFQKIVLDPNLSTVSEFYDRCEQLVVEYQAELKAARERNDTINQTLDMARGYCSEVKKEKRRLYRQLVEVLSIMDALLGQRLARELDKTEDRVTHHIDRLLQEGGIDELENDLNTLRASVLKLLLDWHLSLE